jgi:hypothetical protein
MTDEWTTTLNGIRIDQVTGEARFQGTWYPSFTDALKALREYERAALIHAEEEMDRRRDEQEDYRMNV